MPKAKNVTVIPATLNIHTKTPTAERVRRRVAAYARVSTDSEEQLTSYEAQVDYYTKFIQENPDWDFVEVYTDEGISAVNTKHRDGFNRMIRDALAGKIDLIVTKSVSRFARNTVDSLTTIRRLKEAGCECFFQKENIMTFDSKGELLITIMSSLAQEESRSISENVTWGQRKRFSDGKVSIPYGQFLGYRKGADGLPEIVPEEAEVVRRIYRELLQGKSTNVIAAMLTEEGIPTPGKKTVWQRATVESILRNEKYKGSALLQKSFTVDFLTKKTKINEGEVPQYYVEDSHPAIIEPWEWEKVQSELERRKNSRTRHRQTSPFSGKIFCADCGEIFGSKTWHSTDRYRRIVWQCNGKFKREHKCETPHLTEERLKELFLAALGEYLSDRNAAIDQLRCAQRTLTDTDFIDADIQALEEELTGVTGMLRLCIEENAANTTTEEPYRTTHADLCRRFEETEAKLAALHKQRDRMKADAIAIGGMVFELGELTALPLTFDEKLWNGTVDHVTVHANERVVFRFKDGKEIVTRL
jgi:site-specific DNA recombinase